MENYKNNLTIDELKEEYNKVAKHFKELEELIQQKDREETEKKRRELTLKKENRQKEVDDAFEKYVELSRAYERDYGSYILTRNSFNDFLNLLFN